MSIIGMGNNTSEDGFSWEDYVDFMGGAQNLMKGGRFKLGGNTGLNVSGGGAGNGLITSASGGVNLNHEFSKKAKLNVSYFVYRAETDLLSQVLRNNLLDTGYYNTLDSSTELSTQWSHRVNFRYDQTLDSMREITITGSGSYATDVFNGDYTNLTTTSGEELINSGARNNGYNGFNYTGGANLIFRNKFKKEGRNLVLEGGGGFGSSEYTGNLNNTSLFLLSGVSSYDTINQNMAEIGDNFSWDAKASYTEPLGKSRFLMFTASHGEDKDDNVYDVYDYIIEPTLVQTYNSLLSSNYKRGYNYTTGEAAFRWIKNKWNFNPGVKFKVSRLQGEDAISLEQFDTSVFNVLPHFSIRFNPNRSSRLRINYSTSVSLPDISQLQTKIDNSDLF